MYKLLFLLLPFGFFANIYDYSLPGAQGGSINFSDYRGKKILIVNTASNSQFVGQYDKLEQLYEKYRDSLVVIAVPSNSFGNEQGNDSTIYDYAASTYGVNFPIAARSEVIGDSIIDVYQWLTQRNLNGVMDNPITSDFEKILINSSGQIIGVFSSAEDPMSNDVQNAITGNQ